MHRSVTIVVSSIAQIYHCTITTLSLNTRATPIIVKAYYCVRVVIIHGMLGNVDNTRSSMSEGIPTGYRWDVGGSGKSRGANTLKS